MKQITLTIEEMKELESLGIDTSDASMYQRVFRKNIIIPQLVTNEIIELWKACPTFQIGDPISEDYCYPVYTLQDILDKLPKRIKAEANSHYALTFDANGNLRYVSCEYGEITASVKCVEKDSNILNSAFVMLKWCKENKYIEK